MELIDVIFLNALHVIVPLAVYLFYIAYKNIYDDRENELAIIVMIFSTLYVILKYNSQFFYDIPMFMVNIPLIISCVKKNNIAILISAVAACFYYYDFFAGYLWILILEYLLFWGIYKFFSNKISVQWLTIIFTLINMIYIGTLITIIYENDLGIYYLEIVVSSVIFLIVTQLVIYLFDKTEDVLQIRMKAKEIEHDKQIRTRLFQISHEIKNPIAVCKGYLDMLDVDKKEQVKKYIPIIKDEIDKTLVLLEDFLNMNRTKINKELLDINLLLTEFVQNWKPYLKNHEIKNDFELTDYEVYINGDYNRLVQVLDNIMKNSIEALKENPEIKLWTEIKNGKFYIYVRDNGEGIPKDIMEKINEPFFTTKKRGTGLGVPFSTSIIEAHDGKLLYESEFGKYTLVKIILPIVEWY